MRRRNIVDDSERSVIIDAENKVAQVFSFVCVSAAKELEPTGGFVVIHAHKRYFGTPINGRTARAERNFTVFNGDGSCAGGDFAADNSTHIFRNIICAAKLKANTCRFSDGQLDIYKRKIRIYTSSHITLQFRNTVGSHRNAVRECLFIVRTEIIGCSAGLGFGKVRRKARGCRCCRRQCRAECDRGKKKHGDRR